MINDLVCEGCGDCSVESNCLSVEPVETPFGRKRRINLSSCNKDFSCLDGFCPSFVTVEGGERRKPEGVRDNAVQLAADLPLPHLKPLDRPCNLLVTGVGGTGVVTVGALITMAAHLEEKGASVLDFTGFAQKFGPVLSYIRLANTPADIHQVRIDAGSADALIGGDIVVSSSPKASSAYRPGMEAVINLAQSPTGDIVRHRDASLAVEERLERIGAAIGPDTIATLDANRLSERLLGDSVFANIILLGHAWQSGLVPVRLDALLRAIELNGVAVEANKQAFSWGRIASARPDLLPELEDKRTEETLDEMIDRRIAFLTDYQDRAYADRYRRVVDRVKAREEALGTEGLTAAVARSLFKLMAYKDEYEVARLHSDPAFAEKLNKQFSGNFSVHYHMAPPFLPLGRDARGRPRKRQFGPWMKPLLGLLTRMKGLRGTALDPFGYGHDRRIERELIGWYEALVSDNLDRVTADNAGDWKSLFEIPMQIRGYGPVKEEAVAKAKQDMDAGLAELSSAAAQ